MNFESGISPASLSATIDPVNIAFVTVPTSPLVITVPVVSGSVIVLSLVASADVKTTWKSLTVAPSNETPFACKLPVESYIAAFEPTTVPTDDPFNKFISAGVDVMSTPPTCNFAAFNSPEAP